MSDLSPRSLEPYRRGDMRRTASADETQRLRDACRADDKRDDEAEWLRGQVVPVTYQYEEEDPSANGDTADVPFCEPRWLAGYGWGFGTAMMLALVVFVAVAGPLLTTGGAK